MVLFSGTIILLLPLFSLKNNINKLARKEVNPDAPLAQFLSAPGRLLDH
jgi:hypothetical protein